MVGWGVPGGGSQSRREAGAPTREREEGQQPLGKARRTQRQMSASRKGLARPVCLLGSRFQEHPVTCTRTARGQGPCDAPSTRAGDLHAKLGGLAQTRPGNPDSTRPRPWPAGCAEPESLGSSWARTAGRRDGRGRETQGKTPPRSSRRGLVTTEALELAGFEGAGGGGGRHLTAVTTFTSPALGSARPELTASSS